MPHLTISKTLAALCFCILLLACASSMGQSGRQIPKAAPPRGDSPETTDCIAELMFGTGQNFFHICISSHGNIATIRSPAGYAHIIQGDDDEGYVVCGTGADNSYDSGPAEEGWGPSTISQPGGANTFPLTITRQTFDAKFELEQTFDWNPQEREILITMALKNISGAQITDIKLARYFDGNISRIMNSLPHDNTDDIYDRDADAVWGKDNGAGAGHHMLMLAAQTLGLSHTAAVETIADFTATRATCTPVPVPVPTAPGDYVGRLTYNVGTLNPGVRRVVKYIYRRQ